MRASCSAQRIDIIYDRYLESSIIELESMRKAKSVVCIEYAHLTEVTVIPVETDRFWFSSQNKELLEELL